MKKLLLGTALIVSVNSVSASSLYNNTPDAKTGDPVSTVFSAAAGVCKNAYNGYTWVRKIGADLKEHAPNTYGFVTKPSTIIAGATLTYFGMGLPVMQMLFLTTFSMSIEYKTPKIVKKGIGFGVNLVGKLFSLVNVK